MLRCYPFVVHVSVSQLNIFVIHSVVKEHLNFHLGVINCGIGLFSYADPERQVSLCVGVGRFRRFDFGNPEGGTLRDAGNILA